MSDDSVAHKREDSDNLSSSSHPTVDINYIKSHDFREVACDGVVGGPTPNGKLWLSFYTERLPLPRVVRYALIPGGQAGEFSVDTSNPGVPLESRGGIVRNVELGLYLSVETAEHLRDWLERHIKEIKGERS